jgi:hypothetical protein
MKQVKLRHIRPRKPNRAVTLREPDVEESGSYSAADLRQIHFASGTNVVAGIWLVIAPVFFCPQAVIRWNDAIVGLLLIVLAALRCVHPLHRFWVSWLNASLGLWLTASPFLLGCQHIAPQVNDTTLGFIVFVAGAVSASVRSGNR